MIDKIDIIEQVISNRRSTKPAALNGKKINDATIKRLLALANWAPTHGSTEPWRFVVYSGDAVKRFCLDHAEMYKQATAADKFMAAKYEKQLHNGDKASHIVLVYMKRGSNPNITVQEEICATAAAVQNILLGAEALGLAVLWSTSGMVMHPAMKEYLALGEGDMMIGMLYMGYTDEAKKEGKRSPIEEKTTWIH